jgi:hypothetical protein
MIYLRQYRVVVEEGKRKLVVPGKILKKWKDDVDLGFDKSQPLEWAIQLGSRGYYNKSIKAKDNICIGLAYSVTRLGGSPNRVESYFPGMNPETNKKRKIAIYGMLETWIRKNQA